MSKTKLRADHKWFRDYKGEEEKEKRIKSILSSMHILNDLRKLLDEQVDSSRDYLEGSERFQHPNWVDETAYQLGFVAGLKKAMEYIPKNND